MKEDNLFWSPNIKQTKIILFTVLTATTSTLHTHSENVCDMMQEPLETRELGYHGVLSVHGSNTTVENNSFQHWACGKPRKAFSRA